MYVCICHAVTDRQVETAIDAGARSVTEVGFATRAGASCATCHDVIDDLIEDRCGTCPMAAMRVA